MGFFDSAPNLDSGTPCEALIVHSQPMGICASGGSELYAIVLRVTAPGQQSFETQVGSAVPVNAIALVRPGKRVAARQMPDGTDHEIVIDWDAALEADGTTRQAHGPGQADAAQ